MVFMECFAFISSYFLFNQIEYSWKIYKKDRTLAAIVSPWHS